MEYLETAIGFCQAQDWCMPYLKLAFNWTIILTSIVGSITLFATAFVQLPPFRKYAGPVDSFRAKLILWAPTFGTNPQTKKIIEALESYQQASKPVEEVELK